MAAFIKFEGVDGEAKDKDHQAWSDLGSFGQSIHQPGGGSTGPSRRRGDVILDDILVGKQLDKASPKIAEAALKGTVFPVVRIDVAANFSDAGRVTYYQYELRNVVVSSYTITGSGRAREIPSEEATLSFEEIKVTYTEIGKKGKKKGNHEYSWKVEEGGS
jgi:type VI secretion system secreted protein Hcp